MRSDVRGQFDVGPMRVRLSDPFGLVDAGPHVREHLLARGDAPRWCALPAVPLSGAWTGAGDNRPRAFASGSAEDVTVREYRRGDDLRRVHWRSSAHAGELMVRREEQPWQSRATLFLDNRRSAHRGQGAASSLEHAVSLAASIAVHLVQRGFMVRLVTAGAEGRTSAAGLLARARRPPPRARPSWSRWPCWRPPTTSASTPGGSSEAGHSGLLIAVLGAVAERTPRRWAGCGTPPGARWRSRSTCPRGVPTPGAATAPAGRTAAWLGTHGWRAVAAGPAGPAARGVAGARCDRPRLGAWHGSGGRSLRWSLGRWSGRCPAGDGDPRAGRQLARAPATTPWTVAR